MNDFTNVFGGENINPVDLSYKFYDFSSPDLMGILELDLVWPFEALDGARVVADKIDVLPIADGVIIRMPDATLVSVGEDVLWNNVGSNSATVVDYHGNTLLSLAPGKQWYLYLISNTDSAGDPLVAGVWRATQLGAGTSSADAAALAGYGLRARGSKLDQNVLTTGYVAGNTTLTSDSRAQVIRNTGGIAVHTIAAAATLGPPPLPSNGWFVVEINSGTGTVAITPQAGELIDGSANKVLNPGESCVVYCFGGGFATMGYGRAFSSSVTGALIDLAGSGDKVLSATEIAAQVQDYGGTLTGDRVVVYGTTTGYWFVYNNSAQGAFTVKARGGPTAPVDLVTIAPGSFTILRNQGGVLDVAFTASAGTVSQIQGVTGEIVTSPASPPGITSTGTIGLANVFVSDPSGNQYGTEGTDPAHATLLAQFKLDIKGRIFLANEFPLNIKAAVPINSALFSPVISDATGAAGGGLLVFNKQPTIIDAILTGVPTAPTPVAPHLNDNTIVNTAYLTTTLLPYAPLNSPIFTGDPTVPDQAAGDHDQSIANTKFVTDAVQVAFTTQPQVASFFAITSTFTPIKSGVFRVILTGAGGGGAGTANTAGLALGGAGGGAGATIIAYMNLNAGTAYPVTAGLGGGGGGPTGIGGNGAPGGASTFNGATAGGGGGASGGNLGGPPGAGGVGSGPGFISSGGQGMYGIGSAYFPANAPTGCTDRGAGGSSWYGSWPALGAGGPGGFPQNASGTTGQHGHVLIEQISFT